MQSGDRRSQSAVRQSLRAVLPELSGDLTQQVAVRPLRSKDFSLQFKVVRKEAEDRRQFPAVLFSLPAVPERFPEDLSAQDDVLREQQRVLSTQDEDRTRFAAVLERLPEDRGVPPATPGKHRKDGRGLVEVMTTDVDTSCAHVMAFLTLWDTSGLQSLLPCLAHAAEAERGGANARGDVEQPARGPLLHTRRLRRATWGCTRERANGGNWSRMPGARQHCVSVPMCDVP